MTRNVQDYLFKRMPTDVREHVLSTLARFGEYRWDEVFAPYDILQASWMTWSLKEMVLDKDMLYKQTLDQIEFNDKEFFAPNKLGEFLKKKFDSYLAHINETGKLPGEYIVAFIVDGKLKLLTGLLRIAAAFKVGMEKIPVKIWIGEVPSKIEQAKTILSKVQLVQEQLKATVHECMHPECYKQAIASHSQQKKGQLSEIAKNGYVYALERNHRKELSSILIKGAPKRPRIVRQHINEVSTYPGYCNHHDTQVFAVIERQPLVKGCKDQVLAFHLRGLSYTNARQRYEMTHGDLFVKHMSEDLGTRLIQPQLVNWHIHVPADRRQLINPCFKKSAKAELRYVWRIINKNIGVSCTSSVTLCDDNVADAYVGVATDYLNQRLLRPRPFASLNVVPHGDVTHVVVAWHKRINSLVKDFVDRLNSKDVTVFQTALNDVIFNRSEDYAVSPKIWEALPIETQQMLEAAIVPEHIRGPLDKIPEIIDLNGCVIE